MQSKIPFICKKLYEKNLIVGLEGNVSERKGEGLLITASQVSKSDIQEKDLCWVDLNGKSLEKEKQLKQNHLKTKQEIESNQSQAKDSEFSEKDPASTANILKKEDTKTKHKKDQKENLDYKSHFNLKPHQGTQKPSSELAMHLAVYKTQKKAQAIIHAHPSSAIALSLARPQWKFLPLVLPEMIVLMGQVPILPYVCPGTKELGDSLRSYVKKYQTLILSHHGAVVWAESLNKAFYLMEQLEQCCKVLILAESLGGAKELPKKELKKLIQN